MSNRYYTSSSAYSFERMVVSLMGSATINGASINLVGLQSASITKTATGIYTVALADPFKALLSANVEILSPTAANLSAQIVSMDVSGAQTVVIRVVAGAVPTDLATGQGLLIRLDLRNSSS